MMVRVSPKWVGLSLTVVDVLTTCANIQQLMTGDKGNS